MQEFMRVPREFAKSISSFKDCFIHHAMLQNFPEIDANLMFATLPEVIARAFCFQDSFTYVWRYDLGTPAIKLSGGREIIGTLQFQEVRKLVSVIKIATQVLDHRTLHQYLDRLANVKKHPDVLAEFQPLLHREELYGIEHEARGANNKTIDWRIPDAGLPPLFVEVKSRIKDLIESFETLEFAQSLGINEIPAPRHNPAVMLRSTVEKFPARDPSDALHCVWVAAHLKQEANESKSAYDQLEAGKVHVVVFGGWNREASIIGVTAETVKSVAQRLNLIPSDQFFFQR
jgi:hypothetical protein